MGKLTKQELDLLEKAFSAEIEGALMNRPPLMQTRSGLAAKLVEAGLLVRGECTLGDRFPVKFGGYFLTEAGRLAYCAAVG